MRPPFLLLLGLGALLAGCDRDPMDHPGTWRPLGANDANLRAMAANTADLERGEPLGGSYGALAARPIDRLVSGQRPSLPRVSASQLGLQGLLPVAVPNGGR